MAKEIIKQKTKEKLLEVLMEAEVAGSISLAAARCGISRQTVYNWRAEDYEFELAVTSCIIDGKEKIADLAESALVKRINAGDTTAIIFTLKTLRNSHYGEYDERRKLEERINAKKINTQPNPTTTEEALVRLMNRVNVMCIVTNQSKVQTPETQEMFDNIKTQIKETCNLLGYRM